MSKIPEDIQPLIQELEELREYRKKLRAEIITLDAREQVLLSNRRVRCTHTYWDGSSAMKGVYTHEYCEICGMMD